jgi:hypothetical protein
MLSDIIFQSDERVLLLPCCSPSYHPRGTQSKPQPTLSVQPLLYGPSANGALTGRCLLLLLLSAVTLSLACASFLSFLVGDFAAATMLFYASLAAFAPLLQCGIYKFVTFCLGRL